MTDNSNLTGFSDIFNIICNGEFGGGDYTNISSYTLHFGDKKILLDAGSFSIDDDYKFDLVFLSHSHIDHTKDFLMNLDKFIDIPIISDFTEGDLKELCESNIITCNNIDKINLIHPKNIGRKKFTCLDSDYVINCYPLDHDGYGKNNPPDNSYAFSIEFNDNVVIYFGDFIVDVSKKDDKSFKFLEKIDNELKDKNIKCILAECAFPISTPENLLFGHLKPDLFTSMYNEFNIFQKAENLIITHRKPNLNLDLNQGNLNLSWDMSGAKKIIEELKDSFDSSIQSKILFPKQGQSIESFKKLSELSDQNINEFSSIPNNNILGTIEKNNNNKLVYTHNEDNIMGVCVLSAPLFPLKNKDGIKGVIISYNNKENMKILMNGKLWPNLIMFGLEVEATAENNSNIGGGRKKKRNKRKLKLLSKKRKPKKSKKNRKKKSKKKN